jgi:glycerol-1-phosphate dehydrogenase [NAD(P)+]
VTRFKHIIPHIALGPGVINSVPNWAVSEGFKTILAVTDPNTRRAAGDALLPKLRDAGLVVRECRFPQNEPLPDETSVGALLAAFTPDTDLILGIGSGVINDLCTFVGSKVNRPSAIVGTAPSMDGYASLGSAMLFNGLKVTPPTQCPTAIFCDTGILKNAPMTMIASGLGDMLGKFTALADWRLSSLLTGEPMPPEIVDLVETALRKCAEGAARASERDEDVVKSITEGLILSGIAMSLYGDSRPASGAEHHLAHFWEMRYCAEGKSPVPHGIKVGLAAVAVLAMWKALPAAPPAKLPDPAANRADAIRKLYGPSAETILQTENPVLSEELIARRWGEILAIADSLPTPEELSGLLTSAGAPARLSEIALDRATLRDSILYARDRKKTVTLLQLLGNLNRLDEFYGHATRYFESRALEGVRCFVLDMDGTIYLGDRLFPFTPDFLRRITESGRDYIFFTNNSSQNAAHYIAKLAKMGIEIPPEKLLMSTHVLLDYLEGGAPGRRVFVSGTQSLIDDFAEAGYTVTEEDPDFCVLGFDKDIDYSRLTRLCSFVRAGVPVCGVNTDFNCPTEDGDIPDCGALAAAVKASTGVSMEFYGKPSRRALDYIVRKTGYPEEALCFVGDRLYTDIAIAAGTKARSVLVLSGETKEEPPGSPYVPDLTVADLRSLLFS